MTMQVHLSGPIRRFVRFQDDFTLDGPTIRDALQQLTTEYPQLKPVLFDGDGSVRKVHRVFVNSQPIDDGGLDKNMTATDRVEILTAIAGG
jgi:molybdopterin synthase sulfur carrier subunit